MVYSILVVEGDPKIARIVRVYLEGAGFRVVHADKGKDALDTALKETPLLVILDRDRRYAGNHVDSQGL